MAAADEAERMAIRKRSVEMLKEIENRETGRAAGREGYGRDVAEAAQRRSNRPRSSCKPPAGRTSNSIDAKALQMLESRPQRYEAQEAYYKEGRITIDRFADASQQLAEAELRTAKNAYDRIAAKKRHLDRLKEIEAREEAELKAGRGTMADVSEASVTPHRGRARSHDAVTARGHRSESRSSAAGRARAELEQLQKERAAGPTDRSTPQPRGGREHRGPATAVPGLTEHSTRVSARLTPASGFLAIRPTGAGSTRSPAGGTRRGA